ncbi:MAG: hypothetical protein LBS30_01980 [Planctomycetota bacterium]|jgi:hypothetical protein|nr:hypothetical protein [Planctomycetota bacterium]
MLTISKPTLFSPDGLAARGQCNPDSPGWQLRWADRQTPPVAVWQGAYKTCRHLQASCAGAASLEEVKAMVEELLNANAFSRFASQPTDAYPTPTKGEKPEKAGAEETADSPAGSGRRKKKKRKQ